jgi:hypothetical protein
MIEGAHVPQGQLSSTSDKGIWLIQVQALLRERERERFPVWYAASIRYYIISYLDREL